MSNVIQFRKKKDEFKRILDAKIIARFRDGKPVIFTPEEKAHLRRGVMREIERRFPE